MQSPVRPTGFTLGARKEGRWGQSGRGQALRRFGQYRDGQDSELSGAESAHQLLLSLERDSCPPCLARSAELIRQTLLSRRVSRGLASHDRHTGTRPAPFPKRSASCGTPFSSDCPWPNAPSAWQAPMSRGRPTGLTEDQLSRGAPANGAQSELSLARSR